MSFSDTIIFSNKMKYCLLNKRVEDPTRGINYGVSDFEKNLTRLHLLSRT